MRARLYWIKRQLRTPPGDIKRKALRRLTVAKRNRWNRWLGERRATYLHEVPQGQLNRCMQTLAPTMLSGSADELAVLAELYLAHRFDLLGSGWVKVGYGRECTGFGGYRYSAPRYPAADADGKWLAARINHANLAEAQRIWRLVDAGYEAIDWQLDFKSGYRWGDAVWYLDIAIPADAPGADIKVPWELARGQHLPQLALAYAAAAGVSREARECHAREFRNQVLDFLANNPPGYGVNWRCTMDVAIRVSNWLMAHDLFIGAGADFDTDFEALFLRSVMEHGRHIVGNVEWSESGRSNHYLSNVVGLLAVVAYLPRTDETEAWAGWALRELVLEVEDQFDSNGCNREGSTSYHRLSTEMVIYGTAFACRLLRSWPKIVRSGIKRVPHLSGWGGRSPAELARAADDLAVGTLPLWYWRRLFGMGLYVVALTKPNGTMPQLGDNDSGRFLKLQARFDMDEVAAARECFDHLDGYRERPDGALHPNEVGLDHRHLLGALGAFFAADAFRAMGSGYQIEAAILAAIAGLDSPCPPGGNAVCRIGATGDLHSYLLAFENAPAANRQRYEFALPPGNSSADVSAEGFQEFGIFVLRRPGLYAAFRCGPAEQYGQGSHLHHDQLALDLIVGGDNLVLDPGSYVYTPLPASRNAYRSLRAHFAPWPAIALPGSSDDSLFAFRNIYRAECLYFQPDGMVGRHVGFGGATFRMVTIENDRLVIRDFSAAVPLERCPFDGDPPRFRGLPFSDGYGRLRR
jgi:hypothetical protein